MWRGTLRSAPPIIVYFMKRFIGTFCFFILLSAVFSGFTELHAQNAAKEEIKHKVSGKVVIEQTGAPLGYATVALVGKRDTSSIFANVSGPDGNFTVEVPAGEYFFDVSMIGYERYGAEMAVSADVELGDVAVKAAVNAIEGIVVTAPPIVHGSEGFSINPGVSEVYKGMALDDILRFSPGFLVTGNEMKVYGKEIAKVYINEREVRFSGEELINYLRMYGQKNIRKIDVILNSGAEEDASVSGSRILKITTNRMDDGGSLRIAMNTMLKSTSHMYSPNMNLNVRKGKFSGYLTGSYITAKFNDLVGSKNIFYNTRTTIERDERQVRNVDYNFPVTVGLGYDIDARNILSLEAAFRSSSITGVGNETSTTTLGDVQTASGIRTVLEKNRNNTFNLSANYVHTPRNGGRLVVKADMHANGTRRDENDDGRYVPVSTLQRLNRDESSFTAYTLSADYSKPNWKEKGSFSTGAKFFTGNNHSDVENKTYTDGVFSEDDYFADIYNYDESVLAAYVTQRVKLNRFDINTGLRAEYSIAAPNSISSPKDNHTSRYLNLFPSLTAGYMINETKGHLVSLSYRRSITRPQFMVLHPGIITRSNDNSLYFMGNPYLKPSLGNSLSAALVLFNGYRLSASYSGRKNTMESIIFNDESSDILYEQYRNMASTEGWRFGFYAPVTIARWLSASLSSEYDIMYTTLPDETIRTENLLSYLNMTFTLPYSVRLMVNLGYTPFSNPFGGAANTTETQKKPYLGLSLYKNFLDNKLSVSLSASDLLDSYSSSVIESFSPDFHQYIYRNTNNRMYNISVSYNLQWGNRAAKIARVEQGNTEEQNRNANN